MFSFFTRLFTLLALFSTAALASPVHASQTKALRAVVGLSPGDIQKFLDAHNTIRSQHNAPPLTWSFSLAFRAAIWADRCNLAHSGGSLWDKPYGENIAAATGVFPIEAAVSTFVSDKDQYDPANPTYLRFTQVIWKSTTEVGCAIATCRDAMEDVDDRRQTLYVCLYNPVGNVVGQAPENVQL